MISKTLSALKWSILGSNLPQIINFFVSIYIARLLAPADYGLVALAGIFIYFLQEFFSGGLTTALIQQQGTDHEIEAAANFIFTFNLIISVLFYLVLFILSPYIALFFNNPEAKDIIIVFSLVIIINAFGAVQLALLKKKLILKLFSTVN
ncbi:MAG: oligosaccharide flippase family protein [candidate division WOR-3 bacterium]|nr:oligosaccharide flippase family protein [candidate division WOR-3 bacterium]